MKTLIALVVAFIITTGTTAVVARDSNVVGHTKNKSLFVFKAKKKFVGATVEIYTSQGKLLTTQSMSKRKMVIDFGDVTEDTYTIRIVKGDATKEFHFIKS